MSNTSKGSVIFKEEIVFIDLNILKTLRWTLNYLTKGGIDKLSPPLLEKTWSFTHA